MGSCIPKPSDNDEDSSQRSSQSSNNYHGVRSTQPVIPDASKHHNCITILREGGLIKDRNSLEKYDLNAGVFLNNNKMKYRVDERSKNHFTLFAECLTIEHVEKEANWKWVTVLESTDVSVQVAELIEVSWLQVDGVFSISNLSPDTFYQVIFVVKITDDPTNCGWENPLKLILTLPNGDKETEESFLINMPQGKWIEIPAGIFTTSSHVGEVEFSLQETQDLTKKGLQVKGVLIQPTTQDNRPAPSHATHSSNQVQ